MYSSRYVFLSLLTLGCARAPLQELNYPGGARPGRHVTPELPRSTARAEAPPSAKTPPAAPNPEALEGELAPANRFGAAPFADSAPLLLEQAAPNGSWLVVCQAKRDTNQDGQLSVSTGPRGETHGDALERLLVAPGGRELAIDALLATDSSGRFALLSEHGALTLWDGQTGKAQDLSSLGADIRQSAESFAAVRALSFDSSGEQFLYVRAGEHGQKLVVRSLHDASERELDPGPGWIWRARFDPGGAFVVVEMLSRDTNQNKKTDLPAPLLPAPRACSGSPGRFHAWPERGGRVETVLVPLQSGAPIHEPALLMPVGDALLLRDETGALLLERAGKRRVLEPASCKGRVVHADLQRELFIVGCVEPKHTGRVSLELITASGRKPLAIELASVELDARLSDAPRLLPLYPGAETSLFDADRRELLPLQSGDVVIATRAGRALVRRGKSLVAYDADAGTGLVLPHELGRYPDILVTPPYAFVSPVLVNLDTLSVVGVSNRRPLALSNQGELLLADSDPDSARLVRGPLRWVKPGP